MKPELRHVGRARSPVIVVNDFTDAVDAIVEMAAAMAPFPADMGTYYPGLRQPIVSGSAPWGYVERILRKAAPLIGGGFDVDSFDLIEASFSIVTDSPDSLSPAQRAPHFDSTDPDYIAVLHYLRETPGTGFFRQRETGIEVVDQGNLGTFIDTAKRAASLAKGYIQGSDPHYEQIDQIEGVRDRLAIYRGAMLHSGIILPSQSFSADPRVGRLTANIFIKGRRG